MAFHRLATRRGSSCYLLLHAPTTSRPLTASSLRAKQFSTTVPRHPPSNPDILIVGSGAAALTAALRAKHHNLNPLIIEKTSHIGGTTSYSGGGLWIPNAGIHPPGPPDSFDEALAYMQNTIDVHPTRSSSLARKTAFLRNGPKMVSFLQEQGFQWRPSIDYPDYYPEIEGGKTGGRSIEGRVFDLNRLGAEWRDKIRMTTRKPLYPVYTFEAGDLYRAMSGNARAFLTAAKVVGGRMCGRKMRGEVPVTMGMSLVGQLLHLCVGKGVSIEVDCAFKELVIKDGRVVGAVRVKNGSEETIEASKGVILAAGGFSRNASMRKEHQSPVGADSKTLTSPSDTGDAITAAMRVGAATDLMDEAWWGSVLVDNTGKPSWMQFERALPHSIIVDSAGNRFANEAEPYTRFIHNLFAHQERTGLNGPAFLIIDQQHRDRYVLSGMMPGKSVDQWALDSGLFVMANTLEQLVQKLEIDAEGLRGTVERFNGFAERGVDEDFQRGRSHYDHFFGEPRYTANPNLGAIAKPPFYGAKVVPGDLGTKGGVLTDEYARALKEDGAVIEGLYVVGNSSASVIGREYIGAGSTLGPALVFAMVGVDDLAKGGS